MNNFLNTVNNSIHSFAKDEEGVAIVEYALILAVVTVIIVVGLAKLGGVPFDTLINRLTACLSGSACV